MFDWYHLPPSAQSKKCSYCLLVEPVQHIDRVDNNSPIPIPDMVQVFSYVENGELSPVL